MNGDTRTHSRDEPSGIDNSSANPNATGPATEQVAIVEGTGSTPSPANGPKLRYLMSLILNFLDVPGQVLLIEGAPGTGKTSLALEILYSMENSHKVYASSRVSPTRLRHHFPWMDEVIDSMTGRTARAEWLDELHDIRTTEPDSVLNRVLRLKHSRRKAVLVLDSWEGAVKNTKEEGRNMLESALLSDLEDSRVSIVIVTETEKHDHLDYLVDGILKLEQSEVEGRRVRSLELKKLRGFKMSALRGLFTLDKGRFTLLPLGPSNHNETSAHLVPIAHQEAYSTGISDIDQILGGGVERGSLLLIDIERNVPTPWMRELLNIIRANFVNQGGACFIVPTGGYSSDNVEEALRPLVGEAAMDERVRIAAYSRNASPKAWKVQLSGRLLDDVKTFTNAWAPMTKYSAGNVVSISLDRVVAVYGDDLALPAFTELAEQLRDSQAFQVCTSTLHAKMREDALRNADYHLKIQNEGGSMLIYGVKPFTQAYVIESNYRKGFPSMTLTPVV
jgi:gas vesicle operon resressor